MQVDNLQLLEEDTSQMTQVVADEEPSLAMQVNEESIASTSGHTVQAGDSVPAAEADATSALQALQYAGMFDKKNICRQCPFSFRLFEVLDDLKFQRFYCQNITPCEYSEVSLAKR